jgi:hypothetical protein
MYSALKSRFEKTGTSNALNILSVDLFKILDLQMSPFYLINCMSLTANSQRSIGQGNSRNLHNPLRNCGSLKKLSGSSTKIAENLDVWLTRPCFGDSDRAQMFLSAKRDQANLVVFGHAILALSVWSPLIKAVDI